MHDGMIEDMIEDGPIGIGDIARLAHCSRTRR